MKICSRTVSAASSRSGRSVRSSSGYRSGPSGTAAASASDKLGDAVAVAGADHEGLLERRQRGQRRDQRQQAMAAAPGRSCSAPASSGGPTRPSARRSRAPARSRRPARPPAASPGRRPPRRSRPPPPSPDRACAAAGKCRAYRPAAPGFRRASGCPARGTAWSAPWAKRSTVSRRSAGSAASICRRSARRRWRRSRSGLRHAANRHRQAVRQLGRELVRRPACCRRAAACRASAPTLTVTANTGACGGPDRAVTS